MKQKLFSKCGFDQLNEAVNSSLFIDTVRDDADIGAADNPEGENAQKGLRVYSALFLLDPYGRLELIGLLDEKRSRTCVQTNLIFDGNIFQIHTKLS